MASKVSQSMGRNLGYGSGLPPTTCVFGLKAGVELVKVWQYPMPLEVRRNMTHHIRRLRAGSFEAHAVIMEQLCFL